MTNVIKPPFPWFGGKSRAADLIWEGLGEVDNYVEPFAGSLAVLLAKPASGRTETVNDADRYIANFWRAVQSDPVAVAIAADNPVNECDLESRHQWLNTTGRIELARILADPNGYDARIAGWWVWGLCAWIGSGWCSGEGPWRVDGGEWINVRNAGKGINRQLPHVGDAGKGINRKLPHVGNAGKAHPHREHLIAYMESLAARLRYVRVCCGDWERILTPSVTFRHGTTAVVLDPPYGEGKVDYAVGGNRTNIADEVRDWAIANGDNPGLRIALCGYDGQHDMPDDWTVAEWKAAGGYSSTAKADTQGKANRHRERVWFSPACINAHEPESELLLTCDSPKPSSPS
jgi:DNA adenine methylase